MSAAAPIAPRTSGPTEASRSPLSRRIENAVLALVALVLLAAVVNDVIRQEGSDYRQLVDRHTFVRLVPNVPPKHVETTIGARGKPDITCGRPFPGARVRVCLLMTGATHVRYRQVIGGYSLPYLHSDRRRFRFACRGFAVTHHLCPAGGGTVVGA